MQTTLAALAINNIFSALNQVALILMKKSTEQTSKCSKFEFWISGFTLMALAGIVNAVVLPFIDLALTAVAQATAIFSGVFLSICWLKEPFIRKFDLPALILIAIGSICLVLSTNKNAEKFEKSQFYDLMFSKQAIVYYSVMIASTLLTLFAYQWLMSMLSKFEKKCTTFCNSKEYQDTKLSVNQSILSEQKIKMIEKINESADQPISQCWGTHASPKLLISFISLLSFKQLTMISPKESFKNTKIFVKLPLISLLFMTGCLAGLNQAQLKLCAFAIMQNQFFTLEIILLFIFTVMQSIVIVFLMNLGMAHYLQLEFIPIYESLGIVIKIISGMIFFNEIKHYNTIQLIGVFGSGLIIIIGIALIAVKNSISTSQLKQVQQVNSEKCSDQNMKEIEIAGEV